MHEQILDTLRAALDKYDAGDEEVVALARMWLDSIVPNDAEIFTDPEDIEEIKRRVREDEKSGAISYTLEEAKAMINEHLAEKERQRQKINA